MPTIATEALVQVTVLVGDVVNVRRGPGVRYAVMARLRQRQSALVIGRTADTTWLQVRIGSAVDWVATRIVRVGRDLPAVPVAQP